MKYNYNRVTFCNMKNKNQLQPFAFKQKSGGGGGLKLKLHLMQIYSHKGGFNEKVVDKFSCSFRIINLCFFG
ncbi:hypothetical protein [Helicobacter japonicus]|uniref:hypothetical protein n=1 Tax=Helicobacter japonicus TaxID=425400 RepID=UPI0025B48B88|nr:hypothetical protein [Helicobacter japonicus]